jgi:hypothetical protein
LPDPTTSGLIPEYTVHAAFIREKAISPDPIPIIKKYVRQSLAEPRREGERCRCACRTKPAAKAYTQSKLSQHINIFYFIYILAAYPNFPFHES